MNPPSWSAFLCGGYIVIWCGTSATRQPASGPLIVLWIFTVYFILDNNPFVSDLLTMRLYLRYEEEVAVKMLLCLDPGRRLITIEGLKREFWDRRQQARLCGTKHVDFSLYKRLAAIKGKLQFFGISIWLVGLCWLWHLQKAGGNQKEAPTVYFLETNLERTQSTYTYNLYQCVLN